MKLSSSLFLACVLATHGVEARKLFRDNFAVASCDARETGARALVQEKLRALGVVCEDMCKKIGAYPNCQCPGFDGSPASGPEAGVPGSAAAASSGDTRACMTKYCQDPSEPCPNDRFATCVKENTKVSVLQWDALMSNLDKGLESLMQSSQKAVGQVKSGSCNSYDMGSRALVQEKVRALGVVCEDMCKKIGAYPNCQCPGFDGSPASGPEAGVPGSAAAASSGDTRACMTKYCQDPSEPCPNDRFTTCVKENTKVSVLQWDALMSNLDKGLASLVQTSNRAVTQVKSSSCNSHDMGARALVQEKLRALGVVCEDMCKKIGAYPNCQCPGFEGSPASGPEAGVPGSTAAASSGDTRACMTKYCQDPSEPCPNDRFATCVKENTKVSVLQWDALMSGLDQGIESIVQSSRKA